MALRIHAGIYGCILAALLMGGCSGSVGVREPAQVTGPDAPHAKPVVLTTFTVLADLVAVVGGEHVVVESLTKPGAEIHGYEPTPADLKRAASADLILENGLGLEAWFARFTEDLDTPHAVLSEGIDPIAIKVHPRDSQHFAPNPHAWMSPAHAQVYVANAAAALSELDPAHATDYADNARAYAALIDERARTLREVVATLDPAHRVLVTCEGAFSYLAADLGLAEQYLWAVNSESQSTPRSVAGAIDRVRADGVPAVFCESTVSADSMRVVADEGGATFGGTLYVDSLSGPAGPVPTYLDLLDHNLGQIAHGLGGTAQ